MGYDKDYKQFETTNVVAMTMNKVYGWMTLALVVSAVAAVYTAGNATILSLIYGSQIGIWALVIAEVALVWYLSARIMRLSFGTAATLFGVYSVLNGVMLSSVLLVYNITAIYTAFFATALTFGVMSLIGYTTKKDLSSLGGILLMGLLGLIIASVVNIFFKNSMLDTIITYVGLFIFVGLTAYDTNKIKRMLAYQDQMGVDVRNVGILGALSLYLDFINLFLYILRLLGNRK